MWWLTLRYRRSEDGEIEPPNVLLSPGPGLHSRGAGKGIMLWRRAERPVQPEPADPPPEIPIINAPDPVVRVVLVGPTDAAQARLSDLISRSSGLEVVDRFEGAEQAMAALHSLPARRRVAVLIDVKLPGLHDAGWLIRRLRERNPVLRLFAYADAGDEAVMEHVALAGVDEV